MVPGLRKYSCEFSLDPNTAHRELLLSEDKRSVRRVKEQLCPSHEDRFMDQPQVLSCTGLRGRCYWEVERRGEDVDVAVSYRGIRRRGESCRFGDNDQSWSLRVKGALSVCHNGKETPIPLRLFQSARLGVFLDSEAGVLSFYNVHDEKLFHIYTFSCSFTEPL
uniref:B30.2/SPRY domain-containing protein n=1 Tax=Neogobius melanostomus TaxID=47308 RepID=A0A8C6TK01_9GOBI